MRPRAAGIAAAIACAAALGAAPIAAAQSDGPLDVRELTGRGSADIDVRYRSDARTCGEVGRCGIAGVLGIRVPRTAAGGALLTLGGHRLGYGGMASTRARTASSVFMPHGGRCRDEVRTPVLSFMLTTHGDRARITFMAVGASASAVGAEPLATRCSGPLTVDLAHSRALPRTRWFPLERLESGRPVTLRAVGRHRFRGGGFRGVVRYRVTVRFTSRPVEDVPEPRPEVPAPPGVVNGTRAVSPS